MVLARALAIGSVCLLLASKDARADGTPTVTNEDAGNDGVHWQPKRQLRVSLADWVVTAGAGAATIGASLIDPGEGGKWHGGVLMDEGVRDAIRLESRNARYAVRDFSDVGVSLASTWPFLVDALITAWWYRGNAELARHMALVSAESFALAAMVQGFANQAARERPFGRLCGKEIPEDSVDCDPSVRYRSFFSGHATLVFVSAGLVCSNHLGLGLLGPTLDKITCASAYGVAVMSGLFRVMSDMHYTTDVAIGAAVGSAAGFIVPWAHFSSSSIDMRLAPVGQGLGVVGAF